MKRLLNQLTDIMAVPPSRPTRPLVFVGGIVALLVALLIHMGMMIGAVGAHTLVVQIPALLLFSFEASIFLLPVVSGRGRRRLAEWPSVGRRYILILVVWLVACMVFVLLTGTLYQQGVLQLEGANLSSDDISFEIFGFYVWNSLDSIPLLRTPETLRWAVPYEYRDAWSGVLLIAFKILVAIPVIAAITIRKAAPRDNSA